MGMEAEDEVGGAAEEEYFNALPEGCIANIVSLTTPQDACRLCLVSTIFRSAADSDAVWDRFLPPDCLSLVPPIPCPSKKDLFLSLSDRPLLIHQGTKSFSLDKWSGKKCFMLSARSLDIVWGDTPRYWRWITRPDARFEDVAELVSVCWFEIRGRTDISVLSPSTLYSVCLVFKLIFGAYGFRHQPVDASVGLVGGESHSRTVYLDPDVGWRSRYQFGPRRVGAHVRTRTLELQSQSTGESEGGPNQPKVRRDGWLEVEMGKFFYDGAGGELEMSVAEVRSGEWKRGLIVQGIEIRPKKALKKKTWNDKRQSQPSHLPWNVCYTIKTSPILRSLIVQAYKWFFLFSPFFFLVKTFTNFFFRK